MSARWLLVAVFLAGCAPELLPVRGESARDGVSVAFCGSERIKEAGQGFSGLGPGGFFWGGSSSTDTGQTEMCLTVENESDGVVAVDRRRLRVVGDGYRGRALRDEQDAVWRIKPGESADIRVTFVTESFGRGDELLVSFKNAVSLDGGALRLPPLRFAYR